ncbi:DNA replication complex GINS protein-like protein psf3 [Microthyrium microscopicum]|uniref:DNA replication complex GINS protein PSF3 n=1 Tax=Microthyrium microscopicum TaxID=703497 RepID=A0A6A6UTJ2_9PEZI|nr:DNA replication complex GINS protein-like protein psf3 [Microthyrium microscopicum]
MSYYDVDAILTDAQKVPCTFEITVPGLGYLEGNPGNDIKQGAKLELPLWLGEMLAVSRNASEESNLTLDLPKCLSAHVVNALKADARTVELRALAPHFYALGARILDLFEDEELSSVLSESFKKRAREIADQAHNSGRSLGDAADFLRGLDEEERQLFRTAHESTKAVRVWMSELKKA